MIICFMYFCCFVLCLIYYWNWNFFITIYSVFVLTWLRFAIALADTESNQQKKKNCQITLNFCWVTKYNSTYPNHHYFVKLIALPFINNRTGYALPRKYNIADRLWIKTTKSLLQHYHNSSWISFVLTSSTSKQRVFCQPVA